MTLSSFPVLPGIGWDIKKTPVTSTRVLTAASGVEYRAQNWSYPRWKFEIPVNFMRQYGSYTEWSTLFPEFSNVSSSMAQLYFNLATRYCDNTAQSSVTDYSAGGERDTYLNLLTAHIAFLLSGTSSQAASPLVGRIADATEGSVSVSVDLPEANNATQAFFMQSKYGLLFWTATQQYRTGGFYAPRQCVPPIVGVTGAQFPGFIPVFPYNGGY